MFSENHLQKSLRSSKINQNFDEISTEWIYLIIQLKKSNVRINSKK